MFDIGFWEICIIGIVGLLVVGPDRLPGVARTVGKYAGKAQRMVAGVRSDIQRELDAGELRDLLGEQKKQIEELQDMVNETKQEMETSVRDAVEPDEKSWTEQLAEWDAHSKEELDEDESSNSILPPSDERDVSDTAPEPAEPEPQQTAHATQPKTDSDDDERNKQSA